MSRQPRPSRRAQRLPSSPIRRLAPFAATAIERGIKVHQLNIGQPDIPTPPEILERIGRFDRTNIPYGPSEGLPEFIDAIEGYQRKIGLPVAREDIFATTGGSEALLFVMAAIADPGDEVIVFEPFYTNYSGFSELVGVRTVPVTTHGDDGYHLPDRATIEQAVTDRTRAILMCSPNNPTGTVYGDDELETVAAICREHGLFLLSDEVYREFTYDGLSHRSVLTLDGMDQLAIVTDSLSKRVSMCGARLGWIISKNRELMAEILKMGQARLCPPTLEQFIGAGFNDVSDSYMRDVIAEYQGRRNVVYDALREIPDVSVRRPEGAFYICAGLPVDDAQAFAEFMLAEFDLDGETLMVAPADGFYATPGLGKQEVRIAYVLREEKLARSMRILGAALEAYSAKR